MAVCARSGCGGSCAAARPRSSRTVSYSKPPCGRTGFTLDELIEALRSQGVTDLTTVKYAILETDGQLSVLLYPAEQPATPKQLGRAVKDDLFLPQVLINDGRVLDGGLAYRGLTRGWLTRELSSRGYRSPSEVLLLTIDDAGKILCIGKEGAK